MPLTLQLTPDQVSALQSQMSAAAQAYGSGVFYDGAILTIPDAYAAAATAIVAQAGWDSHRSNQTIFAPRELIETLFTAAEQQAIYTAAQTNWQMAKFISLIAATPQIDITNTEFVTDIGAVESAGLLTAPRAAQVLAGTPAPSA